MKRHGCQFRLASGRACGATPLHDQPFCFWHDSDHEEQAAEARRLGGLRRRREKTIAGAFELDSLDSVAGIRRILHIAIIDALSLENTIARIRVLIQAAQAATRLLETSELEARLAALEAALRALTGAERETS